MRKFFKDYTIGRVNTIECNVTLLAENDYNVFNPMDYRNRNGNCLMIALSDLYNCALGYNAFVPLKKDNNNISAYNDLNNACWDRWFALGLRNKTLEQLINEEFTGYVTVCCKGSYHAIAMFGGMILNNWSNRQFQDLESFKRELGYKKSPKVIKYLSYDNIKTSKIIFNAFSSYLINSK